MDEKAGVGPGHCNCMMRPGAKAADRVQELLDALRKELDEIGESSEASEANEASDIGC